MARQFAVVTGAASGIGLALTQELLARSIDVIAIDKAPLPLEKTPALTAVQLDVTDADAMLRLAGQYRERPLDYLFANAGGGGSASAFTASRAEWQEIWELNTMSPLTTLQSWWPALCAAKGKAVVTVSAAALLAYPGAALYRASKTALLSMLESLYYETRISGVSLHALCPGMVQSNIIKNALPPGAPMPSDPFSQHMMQAMRNAEPAAHFAQRVLDGLAQGAPFYWLTHPEVRPGADVRHRGVMTDGHPRLTFEDMP